MERGLAVDVDEPSRQFVDGMWPDHELISAEPWIGACHQRPGRLGEAQHRRRLLQAPAPGRSPSIDVRASTECAHSAADPGQAAAAAFDRRHRAEPARIIEQVP